MFRRTVSQLMLLLAVSALAGCDCGKPQPTCTDATLVFTLPEEGATVPGTFDAAIAATLNGEPFAFDAATLTVQGHTFTGTISNGAASFTGVTATAGSAELKASIAAGSCSKTVTRTVTVREDLCTAPTVLGVSFPQDTTAPLGVLNAAEIPAGTPLQVRVEAGCASGVQVRIKRGVTVVGELTDFVNGVATISLPTLPDADAAQYDLFAELVRDGAAVNQPVGAALGSIRVQRSNPSCALSATTVVGPAQDAQPAVTGFQARVSGTMAADSTGTLEVVNVGDAPVTPNADGDVSADFTLPAQTASYVLRLTCVDSAGNTTTANGTLQTDFDAPTVTILSPANNATVTESPLTLDVSVGQGEAGGLVQVLVNGQSVDAATVDDTGVVHPSVSFSADGTYSITVRATDLAGNTDESTVTVTVQLSGCGIAFTRPASSPALLTPAQLQAGNYSFQTTSKPACAGQTATLFRTAVQADGGLSAEEQVGTATLTGAGLAAFSPLMMSTGAFRFRGTVTNADAGVSSATIQVTVDLDGPSITNPVVLMGQSVVSLSSFQDTQPNTPGVQRTLDYSATVPVGARVDVCTTQAIDPVSSSTRPTSTECGSGWFVLQQGVPRPAPSFTFPDGSYSIKIVVVGGGVTPAPESAAVGIFADGTKPCVQANSITLPQDANGDGRLNIAELNGAQPMLVFTPGCGDTDATLSATTPVTVRDITAGVPGATRAASSVFSGGQYTVTLTGTYATEVDLNLFVQLTDLAYNHNAYSGAGDPAVLSFRVDPVAPSCSVASPSAAVLGLAQVPGGALDVTVNTATDVASGGVHLTFTGQTARDLTPSQGTVTTQYTGLTGDTAVTIGATCTDASGNASTAAPVTTRIDLSTPTCDLTAPADGSTVTANEVQTTVALTGVANGEVVFITSSLSGIANNQLTVTGGAATRLVRYPKGAQTVTASYADEAGNECVAPSGGHKSISLTVNNASCSLDFTASGPISTNTYGSWLNRAGAGLPVSGSTPTSASVAVGAVTSDCGAGKNVYLYAGAASTTPSGTPQVTDATGTVTFPSQAFTEGGEYTVTIDDGTGLLTHRSFIVSLKAPTIGGLGLQRSASNTAVIPVAKDAALTFGAFTGNQRVASAIVTDMVFGDLNSSVDGADLALTVSTIDGARVAPFDAKLEVLGVTSPVSAAISTDGGNQSFSLKLPHQVGTSTLSIVVRITSPAGNTYTSTHVSQVDVVAPAALTVSQMLASARNATVNLSWPAVNDDGTSSASGAASYDVRWTTSSVPNHALFESDFFNSVAMQDGVTSTTSRSLSLPPLNTYTIAACAVDEVGNYQTNCGPTSVPFQTLDNFWGGSADVTVTGAAVGFGTTVSLESSVVGDSKNDLVVASPGQGSNGAVYIFHGKSPFTGFSGACTGDCQVLTPPDLTGTLFGGDVSTSGNVADNATESGIADIVVGQRGFSTTGRAFIYLGTAGTTVSQYVEIRGDAANINIGQTAQAVKDIDGDGYDELVLGAFSYGGGRGRVYVFRGRALAGWQALASAAGQTYVPITSADWVIEGESILPANPSNSSNGIALGRQGVISTGGYTGRTRGDGSPAPELVVPLSRVNLSQTILYGYDRLSTSSVAAPVGILDGGVQTLSRTPTTGSLTNAYLGFGVAAYAGAVVTSGDLFVGNPFRQMVEQFSNWSSSGIPGGNATTTISGPSYFGAQIGAAGLDDPTSGLDLVVAEGASSSNGLWVLYQHQSAFEVSVGSVPRFWVSEFRPVPNGRITINSVEHGVKLFSLGDIDAQNGVDLAVSSGIDAPGGIVHVWR